MSARVLVPALLSGLLFGLGLVVSDMVSAPRVLAFLRLGPGWDPTLAFVMAAALAVAMPGYAWLSRWRKPLVAEQFFGPSSSALDRRLLGGALVFGLGWGLSGYCPGPAFINAGLGLVDGVWFVLAMLAGAWLARAVERRPA